MMAEIMGSLPMGVATIVLDFAATETMLFLRELSQPFKRASEALSGPSSMFRCRAGPQMWIECNILI